MVNQDIIKYLKDGTARGFKIELLKEKLLGGGFKEKDVNEAIVFMKPVENVRKIETIDTKRIDATDSKKTDFEKAKDDMKKGARWIKTAGVVGVIALIYYLLIIIGGFVPGLNDLVKLFFTTLSGSIVLGALTLVLFVVYYAGFAKLGKHTGDGLLKISALIKLVISLIAPVIFVFLMTSIVLAVESLILGDGGGTSQLFEAGGALLIVFFITIILYRIFSVMFSAGLVKIKNKVSKAKLAGIFGLIYSSSSILLIAGLILLWLVGLSAESLAFITIVGAVISVLLWAVTFILEIMTLFQASRIFEN